MGNCNRCSERSLPRDALLDALAWASLFHGRLCQSLSPPAGVGTDGRGKTQMAGTTGRIPRLSKFMLIRRIKRSLAPEDYITSFQLELILS